MNTRYAAILLLVMVTLIACAQDKPESASSDAAAHGDTEMASQSEEGAEMADAFTMPNLDDFEWLDGPEGLKYAVIKEGIGTDVNAGDQVQVHYTGWLKDNGNFFDSSRKRGAPFVFPLGAGRVIRGWDLGVDMMKVGGHWIFILPPEIGYGARGAGGAIPPNATLVFDVEVIGVQ
jgi:FKBP-type peptidyl-prolyl cis-trans isomerase FkpA